jgi:hypothetical protein
MRYKILKGISLNPLRAAGMKAMMLTFSCLPAFSQRIIDSGIKVPVNADSKVSIYFNEHLREWDGFGVNYVETAQTRNYKLFPQDYSGFSFATIETRETILEMIFGENGLKPGITKLFLDPFHEGETKEGNDNNDPLKIELSGYDHTTTTKWIRYFNKEGQRIMGKWGGSLTGIVTLYGAPPWMTRQKYILGRDPDPAEKYELAEYLVSWAKYLNEKEGMKIGFVSLHNEGDAYYRWPRDGSNPGEDHRDYNMYWSPELVTEMIKITREVLDANKMENVLVSPGETQTWYRFDMWGYASAIARDPEAIGGLGLITSHSFAAIDIPNSVYYGDYRSIGQDLLQAKKPGLKVWVTSRPWAEGVEFIENIRRDIYEAKSNGLIPWALVSGANQWMQSDGKYSNGSMNAAFLIKEDGSLVVNDQYYYYKQVSRAGQPGMAVASVINMDPALGIIAFSGNNSGNQDSFVVINKNDSVKEIDITIEGSECIHFSAIRTSDAEKYEDIGIFKKNAENLIVYKAPPNSCTTFFGRDQ